MTRHTVTARVNGVEHQLTVEPRMLLVDALRSELGLLGTHAACEQGSCGSCTVLLGSRSVRSCLLFAVQADGVEITTIEGVGTPERLHPLQEALSQHHGLQCGYCTPGVVMSGIDLLQRDSAPDREDIEEWMSGNLCRCTGYTGIVDAVEAALASRTRVDGGQP